MEIQDCIINIENSSLQDRLKLRQVLLDNGQEIYNAEHSTLLKVHLKKSTEYRHSYDSWRATATVEPNITLEDFIQKFKTSNKLRNLAFYKDSGEEWTDDECNIIKDFLGVGVSATGNIHSTSKYFFDDGSDYTTYAYANWGRQEEDVNFSNCVQIKYEDCFVGESKSPKVKEDRVAVVPKDVCGHPVGSRIVPVNNNLRAWAIVGTTTPRFSHDIGCNCEWEDEIDSLKKVEQEIKVGQIWVSNKDQEELVIERINLKGRQSPIKEVGSKSYYSEEFLRENYTLKQDVERSAPFWSKKAVAEAKRQRSRIPNLCCETALPTCSNEPTKQTNKENTMNTTKEELELELVKRQIAQLPAVKDAKVKRVKTDLESRKPFTVVVYDENGKYHSTVYYKTLQKAERFRDDYLATKYGYGCTITIHKEVSAYSTKAPIVKVK